MGRSKNLHIVQIEVEVQQPDDPQSPGDWTSGHIQVDKLLSQELGRTIRNGNSFRLVGFGSTLRGFNASSDLDVGFAGTCVLQYCPLTANGVGAWQSLQAQWMKQKRLSSGVGKYVRYDDFEVGWDDNTGLSAGRNSTIRMSGLDDATTEQAVREVKDRFDYVIDPHGAVGYLALTEWQKTHPDTRGVILETAHPSKFKPDVERILGHEIEVPKRLSELEHREKVATSMSTAYEPVRDWLREKYG